MKKHFYLLSLSLYVIICCFVFSESSLKAQLNCNVPCDSATPWLPRNYTVTINRPYGLIDYDLGLHVKARILSRICNGIVEFKYDNVEMLDNSKYLDSILIYEHNYSAFRNLLDMFIIENYATFNDSIIPYCPNNDSIIKIYSAICGVWLKCRYKIENGSRMCDDGFIPPYPDFEFGSEYFVDIWRWHPCGEVCCQKIYTICKKNSSLPDHINDYNYIFSIKNVTTRRLPGATKCTLQDQFRDGSDTTTIINCQDGC